jgi:hypothetical protein
MVGDDNPLTCPLNIVTSDYIYAVKKTEEWAKQQCMRQNL